MRVWVALMTICLIVGCDRPTAEVAGSPATAQATPKHSAPASLPTAIFLEIDGKQYPFPPVSLIFHAEDGKQLVEMVTNDPPEAGQEDYEGNSMFLSMLMDASADESLAGARWDYQASNTELNETGIGIFLHGEHKALQPYDVLAELKNGDSPITVSITGTFLLFDEQDEKSPPRKVEIRAEWVAPARPRERRLLVRPATLPATSLPGDLAPRE